MKAKEAIKMLNWLKHEESRGDIVKALDRGIKALQTIAELEKRNFTVNILKEYMDFENECVKKGFTFKSLLEAKAKQEPKKPDLFGDGYADGEPVYDFYKCPNCEQEYEMEFEQHNYCPNCGQALDWGE